MEDKRVLAKDRVGTTLHNLEILDWKRENNRTYFYIHCLLCKENKWMRADYVTRKSTNGCGCRQKETQFKAKDIKGMRFGRLIAVEPTGKRDKNNGSVIWKCRCDCRNIAYVSATDLMRKAVRSCGCYWTEVKKNSGKKVGDETLKYVMDGTNARNLTSKIPKNNTSGIKGVGWDKNRHKWVAQIGFQGKNYFLGRYNNKQDAIDVRKAAEKAIFEDFLGWFKETCPEQWENMKH